MVFTTRHIITIVTVIIVLIAAFYFYRQFSVKAIANCPEWNKEMGKLFAAGNYCMSS